MKYDQTDCLCCVDHVVAVFCMFFILYYHSMTLSFTSTYRGKKWIGYWFFRASEHVDTHTRCYSWIGPWRRAGSFCLPAHRGTWREAHTGPCGRRQGPGDTGTLAHSSAWSAQCLYDPHQRNHQLHHSSNPATGQSRSHHTHGHTPGTLYPLNTVLLERRREESRGRQWGQEGGRERGEKRRGES